MIFSTTLVQGILERRYKRFIADVRLDSGDQVQAHCPNTGPMTGLAIPGIRVALSHRPDPKRKLSYTWEMAQVDSGPWVGMNTNRPNGLFRQAFDAQSLDLFKGYTTIRPEVRVGDSRLDFLISKDNGDECYVEIKNAHMKRGDGVFFPDAVTARGTRHVQMLTRMAEQGQSAFLVYIVQRSDCSFLSIAHDIDQVYGNAFLQALDTGVSCAAYACTVDPHGICIERSLPIRRI